ncbi:YciI family protein [Propionibacteriaceae bacterium G1746]|uniref:YciI family protein n=1 Tax=Aestuariimicrobium sp. G57 TaxID=3418485 RepID=UPI003C1F17ED
MGFFAVHYTYTDDQASLDEVRPIHRAYLGGLAQSGVLFASGPLLETDPGEALLLFRAESADEVVELLDTDPFHEEGLIAQRRVQAWDPLIGALANKR